MPAAPNVSLWQTIQNNEKLKALICEMKESVQQGIDWLEQEKSEGRIQIAFPIKFADQWKTANQKFKKTFQSEYPATYKIKRLRDQVLNACFDAVWNPFSEKSSQLLDLPAKGWPKKVTDKANAYSVGRQ